MILNAWILGVFESSPGGTTREKIKPQKRNALFSMSFLDPLSLTRRQIDL